MRLQNVLEVAMPQVVFAADDDVHAKLEAWVSRQPYEMTKAAAARFFVNAGMLAAAPWLKDVTKANPTGEQGNEDEDAGEAEPDPEGVSSSGS